MGLSSFSYICLTNNPALEGMVAPLEYMGAAASVDVLKRGRALVQEGWELLASPLYGNFKPNQQPYRTLILRKNNGPTGLPDIQSLSLIEDAVRFYENSHHIMPPGGLADNIEKDFRYMDVVLLEETFRQYGLLTSPVKSYSEVVDR
ncbi:GrdX family protein [Cloacibacillus sp. An23]|uniref:GrdX family protein n=1 Tax=Cloacibacillus sp. An23 TaxID=1965591 RepID=UPI0021012971|nr:GrdX family protein [Cloacibacillus sp. An23]